MFALAFTAMAVLAVVGVEIFSARARNGVDQHHQASLAATSLMWQAVDTLHKDFSKPLTVPAGTPVGPVLDPSGGLTYSLVTTAPAPPLTSADLWDVEVIVNWKSRHGPGSLMLTTKVAAP